MGSGVRVFALLLLVAVLAVGGLFWFDFLGLISADEWLGPVRRLVGLAKEALEQGEFQWAIHLLAKMESGVEGLG